MMNIFEINPYVRLGMRCLVKDINMRIIFDYELIYVENGILLLHYNGTPFYFKKGDILLICPDIPHSFTKKTPELSLPHIHFDLTYDILSPVRFISFSNRPALTADEMKLIQPNEFPQLANCPLLSIKDKDRFLETFYSIVDSTNPYTISCKNKMLELLDTIISENAIDSFQVDVIVPNLVYQLKNYIDANYDHDFQLSDLEKQFSYSKYYMDKLFKKEIGTSIIKYRNRLRMLNSISLLQKYSVVKTSEMLGFSSVHNFCRAFKAYYDDSPAEYIKKLQSGEGKSGKLF